MRWWVAVLAVAVAAMPQPASAQSLGFMMQWGAYGAGTGQFDTPIGIDTDLAGRVYVTDYGNARVQVFTADGEYLTQWTTLGLGYSTPTGVAVSPDGEVYVSEHTTNRVQVFSNEGAFLRSWGTPGSGPGQFNGPYGIARGPDGTIYVADMYNDRVAAFTGMGAYVSHWATSARPVAVAVDLSGRVYVLAWTYIEAYSNTGTLLARHALPAGYSARGVAATADRIFVADYGGHRVVELSLAGVPLRESGSWGSGPGQFNYPSSLCVDANGHVLVTDTLNHRIQVLGDVVVPARGTTWGRLKALYR